MVTPAFPSKACGHVAAFKKLSGASFIQGFLLTAAPDLLRPFLLLPVILLSETKLGDRMRSYAPLSLRDEKKTLRSASSTSNQARTVAQVVCSGGQIGVPSVQTADRTSQPYFHAVSGSCRRSLPGRLHFSSINSLHGLSTR